MSWTDLAIVPMGPIYFGDGRPTTAGETDHGEGRFPPTPRTAQGLVRTTLLRSVAGLALGRGADRGRIASLVGPPDRLLDGWQVAGPWMARWASEDESGMHDVEPWLPLPRYLVEEEGRLCGATLLPLSDRLATDLDGVALMPVGGRPVKGYFGTAHLAGLLAGTPPPLGAIEGPYPSFVEEESRVGLFIDPDSGVAEEGMLFTLGYRRMSDHAGLVVRFCGKIESAMDVAALTRGTASIGGKNRLARLRPVKSWLATFEKALKGDHLPAETSDGERFWLWCTTPAAVEQPWRPILVPPSMGEARIEILTAAVGRPEPIGGFSLAAGCGTPVRSYVPPGSSWLISVSEGTARQRGTLLRSLHDAFPFAADPALSAMGFGHAYPVATGGPCDYL